MRPCAWPIALLAACFCAACGSSAATTGGSLDATVAPTVPVNECTMFGPAGAACRNEGVCGAGEVNDSTFLCLSSIQICCVPAVALHIDAGSEGLPDGMFVLPTDGGSDSAAGPADANTDAHASEPHDGGNPRDAGLPRDAAADTSTTKHADAGVAHDAGQHGDHDAGKAHDAGAAHDGATH